MDNELEKYLDDKATKVKGYDRCVNYIKTETCSVWNRFEQIWEESDEHLRKRILKKRDAPVG